MYTVSTRIEPQSWIQPHPKKILIEPHPKTNIERIEPHLELNPTRLQCSEANLNCQNEHKLSGFLQSLQTIYVYFQGCKVSKWWQKLSQDKLFDCTRTLGLNKSGRHSNRDGVRVSNWWCNKSILCPNPKKSTSFTIPSNAAPEQIITSSQLCQLIEPHLEYTPR